MKKGFKVDPPEQKGGLQKDTHKKSFKVDPSK